MRVVAATNKELEENLASGAFREDLYYRLNVIHIHLPPLRDRAEDILPLAEHFLAQSAARAGKDVRGVSRGREEGAARSTAGPATCASWRTSSSARSRWSRGR